MRILLLVLALSGSAVQAAPIIESAPRYSIEYPLRSPSLNHDHATEFAWSPDGKTLATGAENAALHFWDPQTAQRKSGLSREFRSIYQIAYSPDGSLLAIGTSQLVGVSLWNARTGQLVRTLKEPYPRSKGAHIFNFAWAPDGKTLVATQSKELQFWEVATGKLLRKIAQPAGSCGITLLLSRNGKKLATARVLDRNQGNEPTQVDVAVLDFSTGQVEQTRRGAGFPLAWSADDTRLFTRMTDRRNDDRVGQWFLDKNIFRPTSTDQMTASGDAQPFDLSPDGQTFVLGRQDGTLRLRQARSGALLQTVSASNDLITGVSFSPDGKTLVSSGYDGKLNFWRVQNSNEN